MRRLPCGLARQHVSLLLCAVLFTNLAPGEVTGAPDTSKCAYPLGPAAENGTFHVMSTGDDPEYAMIDGSFRAATKTFLTVVPLWGTMHSVIDGRYRLPDGGNKHNILYRAFGQDGWNSTVEYPSNVDVKNSTPLGNAINPKAAAFKDQVWVVFGAEHFAGFPSPGSAVLLRARSQSGWGDYIEATDRNWTSLNQQPSLLPVGEKLLVAWLSTEGAIQSLDFSLKGRFFDGETLGPVFNISRANDGFGESSFTLATDGRRVAAAYISQNVSDIVPSYIPKFTVFDGTAWSREVDLWVENHSLEYQTAVEFYHEKLYLVFDTNDPALSIQGDYDVFMREADPTTLALSEVRPLVDHDNRGNDRDAAMAVFRDKLYLTWVSNDDVLTYGADYDHVITSFNGSAWSDPVDATWDEEFPGDAQRAQLVELEGALHLGWIESYKPPGLTATNPNAKDQRVATRLVERDSRWWDGLTGIYEHVGPLRNGENVTTRIEIHDGNGSSVRSPWLSVRFPDGSWQRLTERVDGYEVTHAYNDTWARPFQLLVCGKPLALAPRDVVPDTLPKTSPGLDASSLILAMAALAGAGLGRRFRR